MPPRTFQIRFTTTALDDLAAIGAWAQGSSVEAADRLLAELRDAADSLGIMPARGRFAPEGVVLGAESRQIIRCGFRIVYTIEADEVWVHYFVHHAREPRVAD